MRIRLPAVVFTVFTALLTQASAAPGASDTERAAMRAAEALSGVLRNCPASFATIGTEAKKCVGTGGTVEQVRVKLTAAWGTDLYGVWRSRDEQRSVFNWVKTSGGFVYVRLQDDPDGRAQTLVYVDLPPEAGAAAPAASPAPTSAAQTSGTPAPTTAAPASASPSASGSGGSTQIGNVVLKPAAPAPTAPLESAKPEVAQQATNKPEVAKPLPAQTEASKPAPSVPSAPAAATSTPTTNPTPAANPATAASLAPVPFRRVLLLQDQRLNGPDVLAVQNRLIQLMKPSRGGRGDGWYGPVTAATVRAFQAANALPVTGRVDRPTWDTLFSNRARTYTPPTLP